MLSRLMLQCLMFDALVLHKVRGQDAGDDRPGRRFRRRSGVAPHHPDRHQPQGLAGTVQYSTAVAGWCRLVAVVIFVVSLVSLFGAPLLSFFW